MKKIIALFSAALLCLPLGAQELDFQWSRVKVDNSRTGCTAATADNVPEALGTMVGGNYKAPNGKIYKAGSRTAEVAALMLAAQEKMSDVKAVLAHSAAPMVRGGEECAIYDWYADFVRDYVAKKVGKQVDFAILNTGGIRIDMPEGEVLKDDIMSMFPFKNHYAYVQIDGRDLRKLLEQMAATHFQAFSGARVTARDGKIVKAEVGGKPIVDGKRYGVATLDFLLNGGDDYFVARNSHELIIVENEIVMDAVLAYVSGLEAEGKLIEFEPDGRVEILK